MGQIEIKINSPEKLAQILISELAEIGFNSFVEEDNFFLAYIEKTKLNLSNLNQVLLKYRLSEKNNLSITQLSNKNWNEEWEKNYEPIIIQKKYLFRAPFHVNNKNYIKEFIISPKMAFGTGHHQTTQLMIQLQEELNFKSKKILDYGCGTGILSIFSEYKGAKEIIAIDIEQESIDCTKENIQNNNCNNIQIYLSEITSLAIQEFDIILANITRNLIIESAHLISKFLVNNGVFLASGFFREDIEKIQLALNEFEIELVKSISINEWAACVFSKSKA